MKTIWIKEQEQIEKLIDSCDICFVGMTNKEGDPYTIPMNFGYENSVFYLHSGPEEGKKLECLKHNPKICISLSQVDKLAYVNKEVACSYTMKSKSIVAFCEVRFIEELNEKEKAFNIIMRHYSSEKFKYSIPALKNVKIWKAEIKQMTAKEFGAPHK